MIHLPQTIRLQSHLNHHRFPLRYRILITRHRFQMNCLTSFLRLVNFLLYQICPESKGEGYYFYMIFLLIKYEISVILVLRNRVIGKVQLLQMFKLWQDFNTFQFLDVVLIHDDLSQIGVICQYGQVFVSQPKLRDKVTCYW